MKRILFLLLAAAMLLPGAAQRRKDAKPKLHVSRPAFAASYTNSLIPHDVKVVGDSTLVSFRIKNYSGYSLAKTCALVTDKGERTTLPPFTPHWGKARLHLHLLGEGLPELFDAGYLYPIASDWYACLKHNGVHEGAVCEWACQRQAVADAQKQLSELHCLTSGQLDALPPLYAGAVRTANEQLRALLAKVEGGMKERMQTLPELREGQTALQAIVERHKGKFLVTDFWATWCGPCRMGMKAMQPLKEELAGRDDVAFVYVTNGTSPYRTWVETVEKHSGLHYRLSDAEWNRRGAAANGIPEYRIFDKEGNELECIVGYSEGLPDYVREVLQKAGMK